ncbi:hypothetical protein PDESU_05218 [Pontiella desulfatans]|uniref:HTH luxR-type domain-containing protein n=1 Tax=Pontiella desulfatans TaxID=2750659 RepID=A0A6C2UA80_PONDE|nr:sigma factor-like helix-turn-helix DNA-binding protein [Pontiella desulfatans]VGO16627.1 hypothetical protein PDESU_05218 [Pontiella desulfatans]
MAHDLEDPYKEKHLTPEQWEQEAFRLWQWAESPEEVGERLEGEHIVRLVAVHFLVLLSRRQQQVVRLYCLDGLTQVEIAEELGITQQTVQQHLMGKLRNGRLVGGAFRRLRKLIHKEAVAREGRGDPRTRILSLFDKLLDSGITRRRARELINTLVREAREIFSEEK